MLVTKVCILIFLNLIFYVVGNIENNGFVALPEENPSKYEDSLLDGIREIDNKKDNKLDVLENKINRKFNELENNIQERLEEYINRKLNALERHIPETLQENINQKFDTITKNIADLEVNIIRKFEETSKKNKPHKEEINDVTENIIPDLETNISYKLDALGKIIPDNVELEVATNCTSDVLKNMITNLEKKLDGMNKTMPYNLEKILDTKLHVVAKIFKKVTYIMEANMDRKLNLLNSSIPDLEKSISPKLLQMEIKLADIENNVSHKFMDRREKEKNCIETKYNKSCKKFSDRDSGYLRLDNLPLSHTTLTKNSTGHLTYFKMQIAVKGGEHTVISLSTTEIEDTHTSYFIVMVGGSGKQVTYLKRPAPAYPDVTVDTPDIVSKTRFRAFYLTIDNGILEFGKEGDSSPLISYYSDVFKSFNYIRFYSVWGNSPTQFLYDCPDCNI